MSTDRADGQLRLQPTPVVCARRARAMPCLRRTCRHQASNERLSPLRRLWARSGEGGPIHGRTDEPGRALKHLFDLSTSSASRPVGGASGATSSGSRQTTASSLAAAAGLQRRGKLDRKAAARADRPDGAGPPQPRSNRVHTPHSQADHWCGGCRLITSQSRRGARREAGARDRGS
jgi:hypothetical protein